MQSSSSSKEKVRIRLYTAYEKYRVTDAPLAVPVKLGRYGLSEVVNHLLGSEDSPQPFDFIINGCLIRGSLKSFLENHQVSTEDVVPVEFIPAVSLSDESSSVESPAWVGCLDTNMSGVIIAGCYDGNIQLISAASDSLEVVSNVAAHSEPVRAVRSWGGNVDGHEKTVIATASKDHSIKCWAVASSTGNSTNKKGKKAVTDLSLQEVAVMNGHVNSVECVEHWDASVSAGKASTFLLSGDWSGNIFAWGLGSLASAGSNSQEDSSANAKKKQKGSKGSAVNSDTVSESLALKPSFTIRAHAQTVTAIQATSFGGSGNGRIYSCSWDHSLKEWDMEKQDCVASFASSKVATSLHFSEPAGLVATSHPDGRIRLWDPRKRDEALAVAAMTSTTAAQVGVFGSSSRDKEVHWVSQVRFHPTSATIFASSDYDGVVKIWDTRAPLVPLGKSQAHEGKALCVDWREKLSIGGDRSGDSTGEVDVLSGGSDCLVRATTLH